jgi:hypothetical protein
MPTLTRNDLMSLEQYALERAAFRDKVLKHKKNRQVQIGDNAMLYFEDRLTVQYQIQEMLRIERLFEPQAIQDELDAYNPLIPDGSNWKATFMMEYPDEEQRRAALAGLIGIEDKVWAQVEGFEKVWAIADEDLDRENQEKTSAVHFLRFELDDAMKAAVKKGSAVNMGIDHANYKYAKAPLPKPVQDSLAVDLR